MTADFPLDSFREAAAYLRRPFTPAAIRFKVQAAFPKGEPTSGLIVAYIDARLAVERLNLIVPHLWHDAYEPLGKQHLICRLTVDGITRQDIGEGVGKGLYSDALKRAAVKFGVGVSLYAVPKMILRLSDGHLKRAKDTLALTPNGETHVRGLYEGWLDFHGKQAFGEPLDHGDSLDAQGDAEVDEPPADTHAEPAPSSGLASRTEIEKMQHAAMGLRRTQIQEALGTCGIEGIDAYNKVPAEKVPDLVRVLADTERLAIREQTAA